MISKTASYVYAVEADENDDMATAKVGIARLPDLPEGQVPVFLYSQVG